MARRNYTVEELSSLVKTLNIAVRDGLMKREHAGAIWKRILTVSGIDTTKEVNNKDDIS